MVDDNTRMLKLQAGEIDCSIFVPFSKVAELKQDANLNITLDPSTREDHLLINHENGALGKKEVREALDLAIDKQAIVDTVTFGIWQGRQLLYSGGRALSQRRQSRAPL